MRLVIPLVLLVGCGGNEKSAVDAPPGTDDDGGGPDAPFQADAPPSNLVLTSTAFSDGNAIPVPHTCDGANTSPPLAWTGKPPEAMSLAVILRDRIGLIHSVLYDIPVSADGLPADIEKVFAPTDVPGAKHSISLGGGFGYVGPCPPAGQPAHTYDFELYALDVATLSNLTMTSSASDARLEIVTHDVASAKLTGTFGH